MTTQAFRLTAHRRAHKGNGLALNPWERGTKSRGGPTSACFSAPMALAATWNTELVQRVGMALGEEAKAKEAHTLLAPTVNNHLSWPRMLIRSGTAPKNLVLS